MAEARSSKEPDVIDDLDTAIFAAATRVRKDPAGIIAMRQDDAAKLMEVCRLHLRDLGGDAACTPINLRHVAEAATAMGPEEPEAAANVPKARARQWQPEACKLKDQPCDERVGQRGLCVVCKARRKPPRAQAPTYDDATAKKSRRARAAQMAYEIDGIGYSYTGQPLGRITYRAPRKPGVPTPRFRPGDEVGTFVIDYDDQKKNLLARVKEFCGISDQELGLLLNKSTGLVTFYRTGKAPTALGAFSRDTLRQLIQTKMQLGAEILRDLDEWEAWYEKLQNDSRA